MLLVCQTRRGDFGYIGGHMQWSYVYVQLSDCGDATATLHAGDYTVYLTLYDVYTHYTLHNNDATGASVITIVML